MPKQVTHLLVAMALAVPSLVCAQQADPPPPARPAGPQDVAARIGDRVITVEEVDGAWRRLDPTEQARATQALYDGRRAALDRIVADHLIEQAAKAKGMNADDFAKQEISRRLRAVNDGEVASFYEQNRNRMQGKALEEMRGAIRTFLEEQQTTAARDALVSELRKGGPAIMVSLDPPRQQVDVASTDPAIGPADAKVVLVEFSDYQ